MSNLEDPIFDIEFRAPIDDLPDTNINVTTEMGGVPYCRPCDTWHDPDDLPERSCNKVTVKGIIYISGPMRGFPSYNYPHFNALAEYLRQLGLIVKNPAENFPGEEPGSRTYAEYMRLDLANVLAANAIVLMPGWEKSEGATVEAAVAKLIGHKFYKAVLRNHVEHPEPAWDWHVEEMATPDKIGSDGIEAKARALVYGDRNESYGPPDHDFACTGRKWAATLSAHTGTYIPDIPPKLVAIMMADLKTSRLGNNPDHLDSRIDTIGYILCLDRIITGK